MTEPIIDYSDRRNRDELSADIATLLHDYVREQISEHIVYDESDPPSKKYRDFTEVFRYLDENLTIMWSDGERVLF